MSKKPSSPRGGRAAGNGSRPSGRTNDGFKRAGKGDDAPRSGRNFKDSGSYKGGSDRGDRPSRSGEGRPYGTRSGGGGSYGSRSGYDDKKPFRSRDNEGKGNSRFNDDKPKRSFRDNDKADDSYAKRSFKPREDGNRPKRSFRKDDEGGDKRSSRSEGFEKRPYKSREDGDRPKRSFRKDDDGGEKRSSRSEGFEKRSFKPREDGDRPKRSFKNDDDRGEKRSYNDFRKEGKKGAGDKRRSRDEEETPAKRFGPRRAERDVPATGKKRKYVENDFDEDDEEGGNNLMTLNKYIAHSGECSRRDAADFVKQGKVKVNGELMLDPGYRVQEEDIVSLVGKKLKPIRENVYILLNKPKGFITTTDDPEGRKTVMELVANSGVDRLYPVGRLDRNTTGLLIMTNDGDLAQKLSHPSYEVKKIYQATLDKPLTKKDFEKIAEGLELEDGPVKVDEIAYLDSKNEIGLEIHSGRNRIVRRIFESLGYEVEKLDRVVYAGLTKKNLPRSKWRMLLPHEVIHLKHFKG